MTIKAYYVQYKGDVCKFFFNDESARAYYRDELYDSEKTPEEECEWLQLHEIEVDEKEVEWLVAESIRELIDEVGTLKMQLDKVYAQEVIRTSGGK